MNNKLLKFVFVFLIIVNINLLIIYLIIFSNSKKTLKSSTNQISTNLFSPPLTAESLKEAIIIYSDKKKPGGDGHLVFHTSTKSQIYPIFPGTVEKIVKTPDMIDVIIKMEKQDILASYLFLGELLIKEKDRVNNKTPLAIINESGNGPKVMGQASLGIWVYDEKGNIVDLKSLKEKIKP
ncbi:MAG: hypothetical protein N2558_04865 [Patescibacteria group bacterium]|nr:hypothetical protein [Patescibacteria group bacterium]